MVYNTIRNGNEGKSIEMARKGPELVGAVASFYMYSAIALTGICRSP